MQHYNLTESNASLTVIQHIISMETAMEGRCNCGSIQITIEPLKDSIKVSLCHCLDCRASGGTLFAINLLIPTSNVRIKGVLSPKVYSAKAASGNTSNRHFCPECGSPIFTTITENPGTTFVKGGLFREFGIDLAQPFKEQWWRRAESWERAYVHGNMKTH